MSYDQPASNPQSISTSATTSLFRRLVWEGSVPLEIRIDSKELPAGSDRELESYFIQAPRTSYLPLIIPDIRRHLADLVLDEAAAAAVREEDWWLEETDTGTLMKWHWPIGVLYDLHTISSKPSTSSPFHSSPLRLTLHLASPPVDKLLLSPSQEACKQAFMGQLKEADFLRWGSTKRVTGLRKQEQDGIWESVRDHNFDDYWRIASKVFPSTFSPPANNNSSPPLGPSRSHSTDVSTGSTNNDRDGAYNVRSIPVRIHLPDGPVLQDLVPPVNEEGRPFTLRYFLREHLPLLFPPSPSIPLAYALIQGVLVPGESEMAWLGACLAGADGFLNIFVGLGRPN